MSNRLPSLVLPPNTVVGNISSGDAQAAAITLDELAALTFATPPGANLVGYLPAGTGAVATTVQAKLRESVSIADFLPVGYVTDGSVDYTTQIQAALDYLDSSGGGILNILKGTFLHTELIWPKKVIGQGSGIDATILLSTHTGDGIQSTWPINSSTAVHISLRDMTIKNINGSNTGGGFVDVGGSFVSLTSVKFQGYKYNTILDQTELADIDLCEFVSPLTGSLWVVNGNDHTIGASGSYTNRISCKRSQFNSTGGIAIIDDGGTAHTYEDNNYNGYTNHGRFAGVMGLSIRGGEFESATSTSLLFINRMDISSLFF